MTAGRRARLKRGPPKPTGPTTGPRNKKKKHRSFLGKISHGIKKNKLLKATGHLATATVKSATSVVKGVGGAASLFSNPLIIVGGLGAGVVVMMAMR